MVDNKPDGGLILPSTSLSKQSEDKDILKWLCPKLLYGQLCDCLVDTPMGRLLFLDARGAKRCRDGIGYQSFFDYPFGKRQRNSYTMELEGAEPFARASAVLPYIFSTSAHFRTTIANHLIVPSGRGGEAWRIAYYLLNELVTKHGILPDQVTLLVEPDAQHTGQNTLLTVQKALPYLKEAKIFRHPRLDTVFTSPYHALPLWITIQILPQVSGSIKDAKKMGNGRHADARIFTGEDAYWDKSDSLAFVLVPYAPDAAADPGDRLCSRIMYIAILARPAESLVRAYLDKFPFNDKTFQDVIAVTKHAKELLQKLIHTFTEEAKWGIPDKKQEFLAQCRHPNRVEQLVDKASQLARTGFDAVLNGLQDLNRITGDSQTVHNMVADLQFTRKNLQWYADTDLRPDERIMEEGERLVFIR